MFRSRIQKGVLYAFVPFFKTKDDDVPNRKLESETQIEPGLDRLINTLRLSEDSEFSPEVNSVLTLTFFSTIGGVIFGGVEKSQGVHERFRVENQATKFINSLDANSQLQKRIAKEFALGALKWGPKVGLFTFLFGASTTAMNVYLGSNNVLSYVGGGALTGLIFKINLGVKGIVSGVALGSILGGFCGIMSVVITYITGVSIHDVYATQSSWMVSRQEEIRKHANSQVDKEAEIVMKLYNMNRESRKENAAETEAATTAK